MVSLQELKEQEKNVPNIMRTAKKQIEHTSKTGSRGKKTSIGRGNVGFSTMNKSKRKSHKTYRGQGK